MPTIVGILTFMSRKNSILHLSEPDKSWISWYFYTYEHLKFHAQLSWAQKKFYNLGPWGGGGGWRQGGWWDEDGGEGKGAHWE